MLMMNNNETTGRKGAGVCVHARASGFKPFFLCILRFVYQSPSAATPTYWIGALLHAQFHMCSQWLCLEVRTGYYLYMELGGKVAGHMKNKK